MLLVSKNEIDGLVDSGIPNIVAGDSPLKITNTSLRELLAGDGVTHPIVQRKKLLYFV